LIRKILVALDGSEHAEKALDFAVDLAEKYSAEVVLLSVVPYTDLVLVSMVPSSIKEESYLIKLRDYYKEVLSKALRKTMKIRPNLKVSTKLTEGQPADKIVETVKEGSFDIIVMGSRGMSGIKEFLLGSVSHRVADKAPCAVLIVK
jgi:nucleotide-binding universal stress UspA family protein